MNLSPNFTLKEFVVSETARRRNIDNTPNSQHIANLKLLCEKVLQPVRDHFGRPMTITSGYRSPALCLAIGSSVNSQHTKGQAADFHVSGVADIDVCKWIRNNLTFDQLILEFQPNGWVHVSFSASGNRKQVLTIDNRGTQNGLVP